MSTTHPLHHILKNNIRKVYLAGPMRGMPDLNFPVFSLVTDRLRKLGLEVTSPAEKDILAGYSSTKQRPWIECACEDAEAVLKSDAVFVLPGWEFSRGTAFEIMAAQANDRPIPIYDADTIEPIPNPIEVLLKAQKSKQDTAQTARLSAETFKALVREPSPLAEPVLDNSNPKDLLGMKKPPLRLVPPAMMLYVSRVMALGAKKYGPYNWRDKRIRHSVYLEAAMRHILAAQDGETVDPESGMPHEAHAAACMGILLDAMSLDILISDLPSPGATAKLITQFTEKN